METDTEIETETESDRDKDRDERRGGKSGWVVRKREGGMKTRKW